MMRRGTGVKCKEGLELESESVGGATEARMCRIMMKNVFEKSQRQTEGSLRSSARGQILRRREQEAAR